MSRKEIQTDSECGYLEWDPKRRTDLGFEDLDEEVEERTKEKAQETKRKATSEERKMYQAWTKG